MNKPSDIDKLIYDYLKFENLMEYYTEFRVNHHKPIEIINKNHLEELYNKNIPLVVPYKKRSSLIYLGCALFLFIFFGNALIHSEGDTSMILFAIFGALLGFFCLFLFYNDIKKLHKGALVLGKDGFLNIYGKPEFKRWDEIAKIKMIDSFNTTSEVTESKNIIIYFNTQNLLVIDWNITDHKVMKALELLFSAFKVYSRNYDKILFDIYIEK